MLKNNKGITLIALVITIIVLLILAGVSIAMLTGNNGILTQANTAKSDTANAEVAEKINMELQAFKADIMAYGSIKEDTLTDAGTALGNEYTINTSANPATITHTATSKVGKIYTAAVTGHEAGEIVAATN